MGTKTCLRKNVDYTLFFQVKIVIFTLNNKILHTRTINITCIIYEFIFQEGFITPRYHVTAS